MRNCWDYVETSFEKGALCFKIKTGNLAITSNLIIFWGFVVVVASASAVVTVAVVLVTKKS